MSKSTTPKALTRAIEQIIAGADALRGSSKKPAVLSAAIAIARIAVTVCDGKASADKLRALAILIASWGAR